MKQASLFDQINRAQRSAYSFKLVYGGSSRAGKRKMARPFIRNKWMHLVLKSSKAKGTLNLLSRRNKPVVAKIVSEKARECGAELKEQINMGNHIHIRIRFFDRRQMRRYLRSVPGLIARKVLGAEKGSAKGRFWDGLAFTRVLDSYNNYRLFGYFRANVLERDFGPAARESALRDLEDWISLLGRRPPDFVT